MLINYLKKKFGKEKEIPAAEQFYSPLRIALHSTITLSTVDWFGLKLHGLSESMKLPASSLVVSAIGEMKTEDDIIFNIYMVDDANEEFILQLFCVTKNGVQTVNEATMFKQIVNIMPLSQEEWDENLEAIGLPTIEIDDNTYNRVWADDYDERIDLLEFKENVIEENKTTNYTNNYLLYGREFKSITETTEKEMLLVGVEETIDTAEITMMLGLPVPLSNINIQ